MITLDVRTSTTWVHYQGGAYPFTTEAEAICKEKGTK